MDTSDREPSGGIRLTLILCGIVMAMGLLVFWNYRNTLREQAADTERLPVVSQLDRPLEGVNHHGEAVSFADLRGKVWVLAYVDFRGPIGAETVLQDMKALQDEFPDGEKVHFVALTVDPESETPESLASWGEEHGMGEGNWWFMTGVAKKIRGYMGKYFKLYVTKRKDPDEIATWGPWDHRYVLVLVDQAGAVRRHYDLLDHRTRKAHAERIRQDLTNLLENGPNFGGPKRQS